MQTVLSLFLLLMLAPLSVQGNDKCPYIFKPGDIVSADQLNEMCSAQAPELAKTLLGTWATQCWDNDTKDSAAPGTGVLTITDLTHAAFTGASCLANTGSSNMGEPRTPVSHPTDQHAIVRLDTVGDQALIAHVEFAGSTSHQVHHVLQLTANTMLLSTQNAGIELLTRINTPPANPTELAATTAGAAVTLAWKDNSIDETGFVILRRDSLLGIFTAIATVNANTTTYTDTRGAGTYWYRVQSKNSNGTSLGSNLVKVTVEP